MKCEEALNIIESCFDYENPNREELFEHIQNCNKCKQVYDDIKLIKQSLEDTEFLPLPENFHDELVKKLVKTKHKRKIFTKYSLAAACVTALIVVGVASVSRNFMYMSSGGGMSGASASMDFNMSASQTTKEVAPAAPAEFENEYFGESGTTDMVKSELIEAADTKSVLNDSSNSTMVQSERMLIKNGSISISVDNYDKYISIVKDYVNQNNGYIENSSFYTNYNGINTYNGKSGNVTVCIQSDKFQQAMDYLKSMGDVTDENEYTEDITAQYIDIQSRMSVKQKEKERLIELMDKADSIEDMITIEGRLTQVIEDIESSKAIINNYDRLVKYSKIDLYITETNLGKRVSSNTTFYEKAVHNFNESVDMGIDIVSFIILLAIRLWVVIAFIIVVLILALAAVKIKKNKK